MSVPLTLLGLLERGPRHGYDLKRDYDAYFGQGRPLRFSQVYATLSRLAATNTVILVSLPIAGWTLAAGVAAGLADRKRPFSLLH
jgi:Transcriptional regulator PadR-like family